ncbi:DUF262 domain-containing protein [Kroppenstedtia eburnea]|uniref:DUF262 domain-containing protein n=1 Tax=Kroppenstedtia eburnea TaxID=714067 RepID=UPI0036D236C6
MAIESNDKLNIGDLLGNRNPFVIPKHQRAYSWEKDNVETFCDDIEKINGEYFFGGIVSVHQFANNGPGRIFRVVDGQQRLVTFTLLLTCLKEAFERVVELSKNPNNKETAKTMAEQIGSNYLFYIDTKEKPPVRKNRLTLSRVDDAFFSRLLKNEPFELQNIESHKKLETAKRTIKEKLIDKIFNENDNEEEIIEGLQKIHDNILDRTVVIHIVCNNIDEAYQLFEVLNDRGQELAVGDHLRSHTLERLEGFASEQEDIARYWDEILSNKKAEAFLKAYLTSQEPKAKKRGLHKEYFRYVFGKELDPLAIGEKVRHMYRMFEVFDAIESGSWPYTNSRVTGWEKQRLELLVNHLKHHACIPMLLTVYNYGNEEDFSMVVHETEKVVFRYISAMQARANRLTSLYTKMISLTRDNKSFDIKNYLSELQSFVGNYCDDGKFAEALNTNLVYNNKNIKKVRYLLLTIEYFFKSYTKDMNFVPSPCKDVIYSIDQIQIEHIYPQNPKTRSADMEKLKNNLGNLSFWSPSDNWKASNKHFLEKRNSYQRSNVAITRELYNYPDWNSTTIDERQQFIVEISKRIFSINANVLVNNGAGVQ